MVYVRVSEHRQQLVLAHPLYPTSRMSSHPALIPLVGARISSMADRTRPHRRSFSHFEEIPRRSSRPRYTSIRASNPRTHRDNQRHQARKRRPTHRLDGSPSNTREPQTHHRHNLHRHLFHLGRHHRGHILYPSSPHFCRGYVRILADTHQRSTTSLQLLRGTARRLSR